jgi:carbon starvation protein
MAWTIVPTNKWVLWGHHFTSVAGAAPIVGPAIAVVWGWLPAFLWVTVGTVFFAGMHDAGALWASVRNEGKSIGALTESVVGKRARSLFMIVIFLLLLMVNAVFAIIIGQLFVNTPSSVIPAWFVIAVALCIGWLIYRRGVPLFWPSLIALFLLYGSMFVGDMFPVGLPDQMFGLAAEAQWVLLLFIYAAIASLLPVWVLLQPRDYINGLQLFFGLGIFFTAVILSNPTVVAPAFNTALPADVPPLVPLLFVTIACGAISGFHGLVASGTTSKQLNKETEVPFVGYLGAVGEGALAWRPSWPAPRASPPSGSGRPSTTPSPPAASPPSSRGEEPSWPGAWGSPWPWGKPSWRSWPSSSPPPPWTPASAFSGTSSRRSAPSTGCLS